MQFLKKDCQDKQEMRRLRLNKMIGINKITWLPVPDYLKPKLEVIASMIEDNIELFGSMVCFDEDYIGLFIDKRFVEENKLKYEEN